MMVSIKAAARASILVSMMIATVLAEPGERMLREDALSALDNQDLAELLEMDLDEVFLVPKTMLQDGSLPNNNNNNPRHHSNNIKRQQHRHLQEDQQEGGSPSPSLAAETAAPTDGTTDRGISFESPSPSLVAETAAPTDATDRGFSSSFFSSYSASSAAPTAAPTMGSGSRGGLFESVSPTAAPSFADPDFALDEGNNDDAGDTPTREVAAAQKLLSAGGGAGVAVAVVTMALAAVAGVLS